MAPLEPNQLEDMIGRIVLIHIIFRKEVMKGWNFMNIILLQMIP